MRLDCGVCGFVEVQDSSVDVHINVRDGFQLLTVACSSCGDLLASAEAHRIAGALAVGARRWELKTPLPALTSDDLLDLHRLLDDEDWCRQMIGGRG